MRSKFKTQGFFTPCSFHKYSHHAEVCILNEDRLDPELSLQEEKVSSQVLSSSTTWLQEHS